MNKDLGHDLAVAKTLLADGLGVRVPRDDFTPEVREYVAGQAGWLVIGGDEDTHFVVCPPRAPRPLPGISPPWVHPAPPVLTPRDPRGLRATLRDLTKRK